MAKSTAMDLTDGQTTPYLKEPTQMMSRMAQENSQLQAEKLSKVNGSTVRDKADE